MRLNETMILGHSTNTAKNGSLYAQIQLMAVIEGEEKKITLNVWGVGAFFKPKQGDAVFADNVKEDNGFYSCKLQDVSMAALDPRSPLIKYIPQIVTLKQWNALRDRLLSMLDTTDADYHARWTKYLTVKFEYFYNLYIKYPAAKSNHHAYEGGLLNHVYQLLNIYDGIAARVPFRTKPEIVITACLYHDFGKVSEYKDGELTEEFFLMGHPYMSAHVCQTELTQQGFEYDVIKRVVHAILAHHGKLEYGSPVVPATAEAFLVHHLDMLSGMGVIYEDGTNLEKSRPLGTSIIK